MEVIVTGVVSSEIDQDHRLDLETLLTTNPAPPVSAKSTAGRRRIEELKFSGHRQLFG
jgi:hypothetical protein